MKTIRYIFSHNWTIAVIGGILATVVGGLVLNAILDARDSGSGPETVAAVPTVAVAASETPTPTWTPTDVPAAMTNPTVPSTATYTPTPIPPTDTLTATPEPEAGATWVNPIDEAVYVYVPAGEFTMGSSEAEIDMALEICPDCQRTKFTNEQPQDTVYVDGFWIKQTEVTNAEYARCWEAGVCGDPENERWNDPDYADHPVSDVDWGQANKYADWAGGRLPTEAEWEKACRGTDGRIYPWGDDPPTTELVNFDMNIGDTTPVGSYPEGASPYGVLDMAGNVWEWTSSLWGPGEQLEYGYPYDPNDGREDPEAEGRRVVRGGAWYYDVDYGRCADRDMLNNLDWNLDLGFRVVAHGS